MTKTMPTSDKAPLSDYRPVGSDPNIEPNETRLIVPSAGGWTLNRNHPKAWLAIVALVIGVGVFAFNAPAGAGIRSYLLLLNLAVIFRLVLGWIRRRKSKSDNAPDRPYKLIE